MISVQYLKAYHITCSYLKVGTWKLVIPVTTHQEDISIVELEEVAATKSSTDANYSLKAQLLGLLRIILNPPVNLIPQPCHNGMDHITNHIHRIVSGYRYCSHPPCSHARGGT